MFGLHSEQRVPWGLQWRSSVWFVTIVVGYGVMVDLMVYAVIIPVIPFRLEKLGYVSVSALTAWLLFAYSVALVMFSPVCSWFSERYHTRQAPLFWGLLSLLGFLVMFMEAPNYPVMVVARFVQGISSSVIWVIGLSLLSDTCPEGKTGQQFGLAMVGQTIGLLAAPPIGGLLYDHMGFRAPFIFAIMLTAVDFLGRLLVIERKDALKWGYDPASAQKSISEEGIVLFERLHPDLKGSTARSSQYGPMVRELMKNEDITAELRRKEEDTNTPPPVQDSARHKLPEYKVWKYLLVSRRTVVAVLSIFVYSIVYTGLEPTLPLRLQELYGFNSTKVGLVFLASAVAAIFATPISGWISDHYGTEWITVICLLLAIPWYALLLLRRHIAFFVVCFALTNFMIAALVSPLTTELASVVRNVDGVGFGHVYGFFNLAYGVGSVVGPTVAGQINSHVEHGWTIVISYSSGLLLLCCFLNFLVGGERPLIQRINRRTWTNNERNPSPS